MLRYKDDLNNRNIVKRNRKRYLDKEKVLLLDRHIFPAMANLTFFFYYVSKYPELREIFDDDIKDLLGIRHNAEDNYGFVFADLIRSILGVGFSYNPKTHVNDFRLQLIQILLETSWAKVDVSMASVFKNSSAQRIVADDFNRVWAWTRMLSEQIELQTATEDRVHRTISFHSRIPLRPDDEEPAIK